MKDRQPTQVLANGAIRYGIYNADGTLDHYEYLKREDAPTVEGTPLSKANLLSDATAAKLWPNASARPEDPTVSQALAELRKGKTKIGDILITARSKPSDAWLLCNGQSITKSNYPQLFELLRCAASPAAWMNKAVEGIDIETKAVCNENSKWFAFAKSTGNLHVYVSEDAETWVKHSYSYNNTYGVYRAAMRYVADRNVYYVAIQTGTNNVQTFALSSDFQTLAEKGDLPSAAAGRTCSDLQLYERGDGTLCCRTQYPADVGSQNDTEAYLYISTDNAQTWSNTNVDTELAAIDYDSALDRFYYVKGKNFYFTEDLSTNGEKTLVGTFSDMVTVSDDNFVPFIGLSTDTIVVIFNKQSESWNMKYLYSTDRGITWQEGTETIIVCGTSGTIPTVAVDLGFQYVNGLLIFTISNDGVHYICSVSDPADKIYKTSGEFTGALSQSGLAIMPPTAENVQMCNYADAARPVPTIIPDSRSHAYIKAQEE